MADGKLCFVIAPIGDPGTPTRRRSDKVLNYIIRAAAAPLGYKVERADEIAEPGMITSQVIQRLLDAPLVIADLTDHNPNVLYEVAIRHVIHRPLVQMIDETQLIPFDVSPIRTIKFDYTDLESADRARKEIVRQIESVEKDPSLVADNPISMAVDLAALRATGKTGESQLAAILEALNRLETELGTRKSQAVDSLGRYITQLQLGHQAPPNSMGQFTLAQSKYQEALVAFQAQPTATGAADVQQAAAYLLAAAQFVYTRPSPEYAALFGGVLAGLESVRRTLRG